MLDRAQLQEYHEDWCTVQTAFKRSKNHRHHQLFLAPLQKLNQHPKTSSDMLFSTSFLPFYSATRDKNPYVLHEFSKIGLPWIAIAMPCLRDHSRAASFAVALKVFRRFFPVVTLRLDLRLWLGFGTEPPTGFQDSPSMGCCGLT